ncbi:MAG TPA: ABC transporter permease [Stellaceae bacterium]|nr:ABC transporter permease [Stellaceae bacterium]
MLALIIRRLVLGLVSLWAISVLVFSATEILPGDVATAILGNQTTEEARAALIAELGLDRPAHERYLAWLDGLFRGDLGTSLATETPVARIVSLRITNTLVLAVATAILAVPLSLGLGLLAAAYPNSLFDKSLTVGSLLVISLPEFVVGLLLALLLAVRLKLLPAVVTSPDFTSLTGLLRALALPALTLLASVQAHMIRMTRAAVLDTMRRPYIEMALLKGASKGRIILRHALPNALAPIVNVVALNLGYLVSGVVIVEVVFTYPGLGRLMVDAVSARDIPIVQATAMIFCAVYVFLTLAADVVTVLTNPRLRHAK